MTEMSILLKPEIIDSITKKISIQLKADHTIVSWKIEIILGISGNVVHQLIFTRRPYVSENDKIYRLGVISACLVVSWFLY